ncbi:hypothetical protein [Microbacterium paraoxydans]|uniref:hypothetical protein n=1 Tax=Microbacterium paraoxydans TaxID=199592 RepID=UPI001C2B843A|nr:hypothetical protein [Microbacterium paraoxydans]QXE31788.1 hypothetical protein IZR02_17620 [Microbacterium paraoxydans]
MDSIDTTAPADWHDFYVDPFPGRKGSERITDTCGKCIGTGLYTGPTHFTDGHGRPICFDCHGTGTRSRLVSSARATARAHAKAHAEHIDTTRAITARRAAFEAEHPGLRDQLTEAHLSIREGNPLREKIGYILDSLEDYTGTLDDDEVRTAHELLEQYELELAARRPVPTGRTLIQGEILATKTTDTQWGITVKILVQGEGWRVWGTKPSEISTAARGDVVAFTATVSASDDDDSFGFYSRPTKAHIIAAGIRRTA